MRVIIAGNHDTEPPVYAMHLLMKLAELPIDAVVLLRGPLGGHPGPIEVMAESLARDLNIGIQWCLPEPHTGREGTIDRDLSMVAQADKVIAYFRPDRVMDGGTGRVVDYAQQQGKHVEAYAPLDEDDELVWVGGVDAVVASGPNDSRHRAPAG